MLTNVIKVDIISFAVENTVEFFGLDRPTEMIGSLNKKNRK